MIPDLEPFGLIDLVPLELRDVVLNITWDNETLFSLSLPVEQLAVADLRWQLNLPWWRDGERVFAVTPNQVRIDPRRHHVQWRRTHAADLLCPIHVVENGERLTILDGVHRLLKADMSGAEHIPARRLKMDDLVRIAHRRTTSSHS
jgi:hypothetical protein